MRQKVETKARSCRGPQSSGNVIKGWGRRALLLLAAAVFLVMSLSGTSAQARFLIDAEVELENVIEVDRVDRDIYAYDLLGTRTLRLRLEIGEEVRWMRASGRVGVVLTDRRVLAASTVNAGWQEIRLRVHEDRPAAALLGKRLALVVTNQRLLGYDGQSGLWLTIGVGPGERVRDARMGAQTGVVLTDRKAYGLSPGFPGFISTPMFVRERIERVQVGANLAQIATSRRLLVFRSPIGTWTQSRRTLR